MPYIIGELSPEFATPMDAHEWAAGNIGGTYNVIEVKWCPECERMQPVQYEAVPGEILMRPYCEVCRAWLNVCQERMF